MNKVLKGTFMVYTRLLMTDWSQTDFLFLIRLMFFFPSLYLLLVFVLLLSLDFSFSPHSNRDLNHLHISLYGQTDVS